MSSAVRQPGGRLSSFKQSGVERWWSMEGEWVEEQSQRRGGESYHNPQAHPQARANAI